MELKQDSGNYFNMNEAKTKVEIKPPKYQDLNIMNSGLSKDEYGMEDSAYYLFEKEENKDWGNIGKFYMAVYVDLETGDKLKKPEVRVVTIKGELETPHIKFI